MSMFIRSQIVKCGIYAFFITIHIPILRGEEQPQCPSLAENPICPCYNFKEGLFLECPSATASVRKASRAIFSKTDKYFSKYNKRNRRVYIRSTESSDVRLISQSYYKNN
ncbi:putative leucine-rich transmembrane protein [Danaus plexippus plexippus]|uniref:Leucine-rich transmembrane protein n=1 Tax=Danaus plexippus plexippus TaxID=278856 RepID=A0A212EM04_DANPL|nr:putative leucine-rich transmembrane protein [Danaus plexippus plexippus]